MTDPTPSSHPPAPTGTPVAGPVAAPVGAPTTAGRSRSDLVQLLESLVLAVPGVEALVPPEGRSVPPPLPPLARPSGPAASSSHRVPGVRIGDGGVEVHVTVADGAPVRATAAAVRDAVAAVVPWAVVDVTVQDVAPAHRHP